MSSSRFWVVMMFGTKGNSRLYDPLSAHAVQTTSHDCRTYKRYANTLHHFLQNIAGFSRTYRTYQQFKYLIKYNSSRNNSRNIAVFVLLS